jgi:hypothetical protein
METYVKEKRDRHRIFESSQDDLAICPQNSLESALLSVASLRYEAFRVRFGREPLPDEPLFFNPEADSPVGASPSQIRVQLADACREIGVAPSLLTNFWNLAQDDEV